MSFVSLSQAIVTHRCQSVRLIATDMDGTLTTSGKFTPRLLQIFEQLTRSGIQVLIVTGRSAGWVSGLVHYLPVWGAIAENGGLFYASSSHPEVLLSPISDLIAHRQQLAEVFQALQTKFPDLQASRDNRFRLTDWTFDIQGLSQEEIQQLQHLCQSWGWGFTYSTVQCHIKLPQQAKSKGLLQVLQQFFPQYDAQHVLTVGDSPNDESLFDPDHFPLSVGVANVQHYRAQLAHLPAYMTSEAEGEGFIELAQYLINLKH